MGGVEKHHFGVGKNLIVMDLKKTIKRLHRKQINDTLWNQCVTNSQANLGYAHCEYLDAICEDEWQGLVYGNYDAVFPLPIKKLGGFLPYVVQPKFCQQLGVFRNSDECHETDFIHYIPWYFLRIRLHLNSYLNQKYSEILHPNKTNFVVDLSQPVEINKDGQKNIKAVGHFQYSINSIPTRVVIELYKQRWGSLNMEIQDHDYRRLELAVEKLGLIDDFIKQEIGFVLVSAHLNSAENADTNKMATEETLGAGLFLVTAQGRFNFAHFVLGAPNVLLKESEGIMHGIINKAIQTFQPHCKYFDFEGSSIPSVANFYKKFNPQDIPFRILKKGL
ncbi:MAG: hypothetical protein RLZZ252_375 [Bacteroidota bacterium]